MNSTKTLKNMLTLLIALLLLTAPLATADESIPIEASPPEQPAVVVEQQESAPKAQQETTPQEEPEEETTRQEPVPSPDPSETEQSSPPSEQEEIIAPTTQAPEEGAEETPAPTEEPTEELGAEETEALELNCTVQWVIDAPDGLLHLGDRITLEAEINPDVEGLQLQWQAAIKPVEELKESEEEWADIPGAHGLAHAFVVTEEMQAWRWRLRVSLPAVEEAMYSEELMLPDVVDDPTIQETELVLGVEDADELPVANITFTANVPDDEITEGTEITLSAEIENPQEDMLLQWQYTLADAEGGEGAWVDVPDATGTVYAFVLDEENAQWLWRLLVTVPEPVVASETEMVAEPAEQAAVTAEGIADEVIDTLPAENAE